MRIGYIANKEQPDGVEYHRLLKPLSLLSNVQRYIGVHQDILEQVDVLIFNRTLPTTEQAKFIKETKKKGIRIICDIDDYWVLYSGHIGYGHWKKIRGKQRSIEALGLADEVWTTHELLASYIERINSNVHIIPNALDPTEFQWQPKKQYQRRIGYCGGITHYHDLKRIKFNKKPVICGHSEGWEKIVSLNPDAKYVKGLNVYNYGRLYDEFDIALAPLVDNRFNRCKSNLKILEAGLKGMPIFVENIHPYTDDARGIYKVDDWKDAIREAEGLSIQRITSDGKALREYILKNYDLRKVNRLRVERLMEK